MPFAEELKQSLMLARDEAHRLRHGSVRPEHLALGALRSPSPAVASVLHGVDRAEVIVELERRAGPGGAGTQNRFDLPYGEIAKTAIEYAMREARAHGEAFVGSAHLLIGLLQLEGLPREVLVEHGCGVEEARAALYPAAHGAT
jgi:ATP-dependent Clp protease ATP-binding subunit ClpC